LNQSWIIGFRPGRSTSNQNFRIYQRRLHVHWVPGERFWELLWKHNVDSRLLLAYHAIVFQLRNFVCISGVQSQPTQSCQFIDRLCSNPHLWLWCL